jgi:hypothetical protein
MGHENDLPLMSERTVLRAHTRTYGRIEVLFVKVFKDALAHLGPYQTLMEVWYSDPGGQNTVSSPATIQI